MDADRVANISLSQTSLSVKQIMDIFTIFLDQSLLMARYIEVIIFPNPTHRLSVLKMYDFAFVIKVDSIGVRQYCTFTFIGHEFIARIQPHVSLPLYISCKNFTNVITL